MKNDKKDYKERKNAKIEERKAKLKPISYIFLGVAIFFLLGSIVGVDESTRGVLPVILIIALIGAVGFVLIKFKPEWAIIVIDKVVSLSPKKKAEINEAENNTLVDETENKYYEIAYGLLASFGKYKFDLEGIKKYIEYHASEPCDIQKLEKVLKYFNYKVYTHTKSAPLYHLFGDEDELVSTLKSRGLEELVSEKILAKNEVLEEAKLYRCTQNDLYNICYKDILEYIEEEYKIILDVTSSHGDKFFHEGISKLIEKIKATYKIDIVLIDDCLLEITCKLFEEGNETLKSTLDYQLAESLKTGSDKSKISIWALSLMVLKALNFECYTGTKENYTSITEEMCRDYVMAVESYRQDVENHPYEKEKYITKHISNIMGENGFLINYMFFIYAGPTIENRRKTTPKEDYFTDFACNSFWKNVARKYKGGDSTNYNDVTNIMYDYLTK